MTLSASRDQSCMSNDSRQCGSALGAGHHTAAFAEPELRGPADRPQCCVLMSKEVMKQEPATRQKYRVMKYLHKSGCEAIGQPQ